MALLVSCEVDVVSPVPTRPVSLRLNLKTEYTAFTSSNTGAYIACTERVLATDAIGYQGVLVTVSSSERYCAFDMACPGCLSRVEPVDPNYREGKREMHFCTEVRCPACGETYSVWDGMGWPSGQVAHKPLRQYRVYLQGDILQVVN